MSAAVENENNLPSDNDNAVDEGDVLHLEPTDLIDAAPPEDLSDEEVVTNSKKQPKSAKIPENTSAGRLQSRVPDVPNNLIELIYRKKCVECNSILTTISSGLMHYNSTKHQNKLAFLFLPHGTYNLPLSKEEIREIETGVVKTGEPNSIALNRAKNVPFRELVKKFDIHEDVRKLDLEFCRLCEMPFSSKVAALQHYSGKKHKKNAENWSPYNPPKPIDTKDDLRCDACNIIVGSSINMETHISGKRHQMKMKAYLARVNAGAIAPPMSSRGFCDFNNVEREEANPVDPSRFTQENFIPENPTGSFLNRLDDPMPPPNSGMMGDVGGMYGGSDGLMPPDDYDDYSPYGPTTYGGVPPRCDDIYSDSGPPNSSYSNFGPSSGSYGPGPGSFGPGPGSFGPGPGSFGPGSYQPSWDVDYTRGGNHNNQISRSQLNAPYTPNYPRGGMNRFPITSNFGPTKFKYNKKM